MNLYREVVEIARENGTVDAKKNIKRLAEEIKNIQYKIKSYMDDTHIDFIPNLSNSLALLTEADRLLAEMQATQQQLESETQLNLVVAVDELQPHLDELEEVAVGLRVSHRILRVQELFDAIDSANQNHAYLKVMQYVDEMKVLLYGSGGGGGADEIAAMLRELECYENIKIKFLMAHEMLLHQLKQTFDRLVQLQQKQFQKTKAVTVRISRDENRLHEIVVALFNSKYNSRPICEFLMENVFRPIITQPVSIEFDETAAAATTDFVTLQLSYGNVAAAEAADIKLQPNYKVVFTNLVMAFRCLAYMNISISDTCCIFGVIADNVKGAFVTTLLDGCLKQSIPNTMDEMTESTMVADVLAFNAFLVEMLFFDETKDVELLEFAAKIDILFKHRFCMNIVDSAVAIMHKDLHDMVLVAATTEGVKQESAADAADAVTTFPRCMISKSTMVGVL